MINESALLSLLADGSYYPHSTIAQRLGLDAHGLQQHSAQLRELGLVIETDPRGIRLQRPLELLDPQRIRAAMGEHSRGLLDGLQVHLQIDSTNAQLRRTLDQQHSGNHACVSETQTAGRGRHGRRWTSPAGGNIYLSVSWHFPTEVRDLSGLSLALGVAAAAAIDDLETTPIQLKWPNDLVCRDHKVGGVLIELQGRPQQGIDVIAGVGINTRLPAEQAGAIDQAWTDLERITGKPTPRNRLAGRLLHQLLETLDGFSGDQSGWQQQFARRDALNARAITLTYPDGSRHHGTARGIDQHGALLLENDAGISSHQAGEARARPDRPNPAGL